MSCSWSLSFGEFIQYGVYTFFSDRSVCLCTCYSNFEGPIILPAPFFILFFFQWGGKTVLWFIIEILELLGEKLSSNQSLFQRLTTIGSARGIQGIIGWWCETGIKSPGLTPASNTLDDAMEEFELRMQRAGANTMRYSVQFSFFWQSITSNKLLSFFFLSTLKRYDDLAFQLETNNQKKYWKVFHPML